MKVNLKDTFAVISQFTNEHKPEICTGTGLGLMIIGTGLAIAATVKIIKRESQAEETNEDSDIYECKENESDEDHTKRIKKEKVVRKIKRNWKYLIAPVLSIVLGSFLIIFSTKTSIERLSTMTALYQMSESKFEDYVQSTREVVGEKKVDEIDQNFVQKKMDLCENQKPYDTGDGSTLCYDYESGRYFYSDIDYIRRKINELNEDMNKQASREVEGWISLNDFYHAIGLSPVPIGENLGWRSNKEGLISLKGTSKLLDDTPCFVIMFYTSPKYYVSKYNI